MELMDVFRKNYLVGGLPDEVIEEIAGLAEFGTMLAREELIKKGDKSSDLFVILDGSVQVYTSSGDKLAEAGPGSVLGEVALVDDQPRSAHAVCMGLVKYACLPAGALHKYMSDNRDVGFIMMANLARVLTMRLRKASIVMEDLYGKAQDPWKFAL